MTKRDYWLATTVLRSVWDYLLSDEAAALPAREVAAIVTATRVLYITLGGTL